MENVWCGFWPGAVAKEIKSPLFPTEEAAIEGTLPTTSETESTVSITVVGASGDLAKKKIFPALFALYYEGCLPKVGIKGWVQDLVLLLTGAMFSVCFWCDSCAVSSNGKQSSDVWCLWMFCTVSSVFMHVLLCVYTGGDRKIWVG